MSLCVRIILETLLQLFNNFQCGKTTESDRHANPNANANPNPYLVAVRYGSLAFNVILRSISGTGMIDSIFI